ncbi:SMC-Scp complex subunit ScpB [Mumia sp. DW29H23]|uniref:SMC-Scp complex subunit ScpB n=1 Tax=Mumia sp. DW29H23 TaxID=3421241 RepID=UPI003D686C89
MSDSEPTGESPAAEPASAPEGAEDLVSYPVRPALEAVLMVADQPLDHVMLASAVGHPPADVEVALVELARSYDDEDRGFELRQVAGGWRFYTRAEYAGAVERFVLEGQQARLTQAALETMAVVAYRQPVSRARVSAIRGVNVDGVMRTLVTRGLVAEAGADVETGAILYATTPYFLERMGLSSLDELPDLAPFLPEMDDMDDPESLGREVPRSEAVAEQPEGTEHEDPRGEQA